MTYEPPSSRNVTENLARNKSIWQQDNAIIHPAKKVLEYLKSNKIDVLTWPARSPDLSISQNVWHIMEEFMHSNKQYNGRTELIRVLERCAKKFNKETITNLYKSIPGCLFKMIGVKGTQI